LNAHSSQVLPDEVDVGHFISTSNIASAADAAHIDCYTPTYSDNEFNHGVANPFHHRYPQGDLSLSNPIVNGCRQFKVTKYETCSSVNLNFESNSSALSSSSCQLSSSGSPSPPSDAELVTVSQLAATNHPNRMCTQASRNVCIDSQCWRTAASTPACTDDVDLPTTKSKPAAEAKCEKSPRLRTVLNEYQLHVLKTCYAVTSQPDQATKERLERMTGLAARVIRVWFQNKRCKDKKRPSSTFFVKRSYDII